MINCKVLLFSLFLFLLLTAGKKNDIDYPTNFHQVSAELFRSGQPNKNEAKSMEEIGIESFLNLRLRVDDKKAIKGTSIKGYRVPIKTKKITYNDMVEALKTFNVAAKPVLIHCRRGSDRTGCFVACYRIAFQDWNKEDAIAELLNEEYGYYDGLFPEILKIVQELDPEQLKKDVFFNN